MSGPYRTALRLPYRYWERAVLDGTITTKREEWALWMTRLNSILEPQLRAAMTDLVLFGTCIIGPEGHIPLDQASILHAPPVP